MNLLINIAIALITLIILWFSQELLGLDYIHSPVNFAIKLGLTGGCIGAISCILAVYTHQYGLISRGLAIWIAIVIFMNTGIASYMRSSLFAVISMVPGMGLSLITFFSLIFTADRISQRVTNIPTKV